MSLCVEVWLGDIWAGVDGVIYEGDAELNKHPPQVTNEICREGLSVTVFVRHNRGTH